MDELDAVVARADAGGIQIPALKPPLRERLDQGRRSPLKSKHFPFF
jgi:hypothetical protein